MDNFNNDIKTSSLTAQIAAPQILKLFLQVPDLFTDNKLTIYPVEKQEGELFKLLDRECGIDYVVSNIEGDESLGLAWRMQRHKNLKYKPWNEFSIRIDRKYGRRRSEYEKRKTAMERGFLYPGYSAEGYFDFQNNYELLSLAIAKTEDIYDCYDRGLFRVCNSKEENRDVTFHAISWEVMKSKGYEVYDWYKDKAYRRGKIYEIA